MKISDPARESAFRSPSRGLARFRIEAIDRVRAQIDEIAPGGFEPSQEILVIDRRVCLSESGEHREVEPGIARVEEATRSRGRFTDEQKTHG